MRLRSSAWLWLAVATSSSLALAQPAERDHRHHPPPGPPPAAPPAADNGPTEAPPPPRAETVNARAGFVWIPGRWQWNGKWDWVAGHWDRERAGKRWREGKWDHRDNKWVYVDGQWEDANAAPPPAPTPPPPAGTPPPGIAVGEPPPGTGGPVPPTERDHRRHEWKLERPVVSSYWPTKGKAGSRIVIHGKNFPADAQVIFAGQPVTGAKVTADKIVFAVPAGAASGEIGLRAGGRHELPVGTFEVAATYDPVAEQRRLDDERRKQAEAEWAARQKELAKDRAAREAEMRKRMEERAATREQRRAERVAQLEAKFKRDFLADADTQAELTLHAQRVADLARAKEVAEVQGNGKLVVRIDIASSREDQRHQERMTALETSFKARGGQP